jgi:IS5 family transposase/DNA-binding transcriptional MerR regulator
MKTLFIARQTNMFEQFANPQFEISEDYRIIDQVLENEEVITTLANDFPDTTTGRNRTPVEQTLRFLVLKHQRGLDYRSLARTLQVNLEDRWFCKINGDKVPCFKTLQNQISRISDETIKAVNDRVMTEARRLKLTKGRKMRVDSTVTESDIHYPTDSSLIVDGIRKITKTLTKMKIVPKGYRTFKRKIKQQINIIRTIGRRNKGVRQKAIKQLVKMGRTVVSKTKRVRTRSVRETRKILEKIIEQTEQVLAGEKPKNRIVSIHDTEARPIPKGKAGKPCEFGQEVQIQEDERFITNWEINNKTSDVEFFPKAIDKHKKLFEKSPDTAATDRSYWSPGNKACAEQAGVKNVSIPKKGKLNEQEKEFQNTPRFKRGQRFRAGSEAKVSLLKRQYKLGRCRYKGSDGMARWVGGGILACNLVTMARLLSG